MGALAKEESLKPVRISELIRADLSELAIHEVIPTERQMAEHFGVSRVTIRNALEILEHAGLVYRRQGSGTFVAPHRDTHHHRLRSFSEELALREIEYETSVIDVRLIENPELTDSSWAKIDEPSYRIERVRANKKVALSWEVSYVKARFAPGLDKERLSGSLYKLLSDNYGQVVESADEEISSLLIEEDISRKLSVSAGTPAIEIKRRAFNKRGDCLELARAIRPNGQEFLKYSIRR
ncbi:MAG: GntR family transcriptional regulator [Actinobacteria bacterium]|nr:GntR family transcriptional regulator [Actinomycetota bacterium]